MPQSDQINGLLHEYIKDYQISNSTDYRSANNEFVNTIQSTVSTHTSSLSQFV